MRAQIGFQQWRLFPSVMALVLTPHRSLFERRAFEQPRKVSRPRSGAQRRWGRQETRSVHRSFRGPKPRLPRRRLACVRRDPLRARAGRGGGVRPRGVPHHRHAKPKRRPVQLRVRALLGVGEAVFVAVGVAVPARAQDGGRHAEHPCGLLAYAPAAIRSVAHCALQAALTRPAARRGGVVPVPARRARASLPAAAQPVRAHRDCRAQEIRDSRSLQPPRCGAAPALARRAFQVRF